MFSSVQLLSCVWLFVTPWTAACQASLSITNSRSLLKLMPIESVMPSNHLILCHPLLLLPTIFPSIRVFSNESVLRIRWSKCWSFSFSINPFNEYPVHVSLPIKLWGLSEHRTCLNRISVFLNLYTAGNQWMLVDWMKHKVNELNGIIYVYILASYEKNLYNVKLRFNIM